MRCGGVSMANGIVSGAGHSQIRADVERVAGGAEQKRESGTEDVVDRPARSRPFSVSFRCTLST